MKFWTSGRLLWLFSQACVGPGRNQGRRFFHDAARLAFITVDVLGQSFFIFRFTDPPDPIFWKLKKKKKIFFNFIFFIFLRLMPVQCWGSVMFFRFVFSVAARLIELPPVAAPGGILPF